MCAFLLCFRRMMPFIDRRCKSINVTATKRNMDLQPSTRLEQRDWYASSGADALRATSDISFHEYSRRATARTALPASFLDDAHQIELDLERIYPSLCEFLLAPIESEPTSETDRGSGNGEEYDEDHALHQPRCAELVTKLRTVLEAYSVRNPRVGYVQGHADLLCFVMSLTAADEEQAFWVYATVVERIFPEDFFARSPKLHGFHVDAKVFQELLAKRLVPHVPELARVDLRLVASLLACKWFITMWVGELPPALLRKVWKATLCHDDGAIVHLLLGLHFVRLACESLRVLQDPSVWEASRVYQSALGVCRDLSPTTDITLMRNRAQAVYHLSGEGIEDGRATFRASTPFLASETRALLELVHFQPIEIARLHKEFMFARTYLKNCDRRHLRGLRQEFVDGVLTREFPTLPVDLASRLVDLLKRDAYGTITFFRLVQLLSVLQRGSVDERAMLVFSVADRGRCLALDQVGADALIDLLCELALHKALAGQMLLDPATELSKATRDRSQRSPLLRAHYHKFVQEMRGGSVVLSHDVWLDGVRGCSDINGLFKNWEVSTVHEDSHRRRSKSSETSTLVKKRVSDHGNPLSMDKLSASVGPSNPRTLVARLRDKSQRPRSATTEGASHIGFHIPGSLAPLSLLSGRMKKKFIKQYKLESAVDDDTGVNNSSRFDVECSSSRVFWCECVIS